MNYYIVKFILDLATAVIIGLFIYVIGMMAWLAFTP